MERKKFSFLRFLVGDVRDYERLSFAMSDDIDIVIRCYETCAILNIIHLKL